MMTFPLLPNRIVAASLICLSLGHSIPLFAQSTCAGVFASPLVAQLLQAQNAWRPSEFTHPNSFDENHFRFIVHAGPHVTNDGKDPLKAFLERAVVHDLNSEVFFSASIVSEIQTATFNRAGLVLEIPSSKIIASSSEDMRSCLGECNLDKVSALSERFFKRPGLLPPAEILAKASHGLDFHAFGLDWTEVLVNGTAISPEPIKISGLFMHKDSLGNVILIPDAVSMMSKAAQEMKLPLIVLPPPKGEFVLKVRMSRAKRNDDVFENWGPAEIHFFGTQSKIQSIFAQAAAAGKNVMLVDEQNGPPPIVAPPKFFQGSWRRRVFDTIKSGSLTTYKERFEVLTPDQLPRGLPPIRVQFTPEGV